MSSPFPPLQHPTGTSLSSCWLRPPCRHLILFLRHPLTDHQLQLTAAAAVTAAVATTDYFIRPHCNRCKVDNIVVAVVFPCGILIVILDCSLALMMMGPRPSFSWRNGDCWGQCKRPQTGQCQAM
jgi:hypothetical protein